MTILFVGGGTMGPVTPLIAVFRRMKGMRPDLQFAWAGTPDGPERAVVEAEGIMFYAVPVAKLPRHPSFSWLTWPFSYLRAGAVARSIMKKTNPSLVASAGGFTAVPVMRAARDQKIPCVIHQLDAEPGLSNKAVAQFASKITTSFAYDVPPFKNKETERVATPTRFAGVTVPSRQDAAHAFGLLTEKPIIFIVGGGTGAVAINEAIWKTKEDLIQGAQIIHATGKGKASVSVTEAGYVMREFLDEKEILNAYAAADLVVSRAGIGGISDLACLSKPTIFVPIPKSHQELNIAKLPCAFIDQGEGFSERLRDRILSFLRDKEAREALGPKLHAAFPTDDGTALAERWLKLLT
ncbi:MAG: glycosyltransferase [Patescibacteria group bacterium]